MSFLNSKKVEASALRTEKGTPYRTFPRWLGQYIPLACSWPPPKLCSRSAPVSGCIYISPAVLIYLRLYLYISAVFIYIRLCFYISGCTYISLVGLINITVCTNFETHGVKRVQGLKLGTCIVYLIYICSTKSHRYSVAAQENISV